MDMNAPSVAVGDLALVHGIVARPELNGQLGLVLSFDAERGRFAVRLMDGTSSLALKPGALLAWRGRATDLKIGGVTCKMIETATPAELVRFMREGCVLSDDLVRECLQRVMSLHDGINTAGNAHELMMGGVIEMIVEAISVHMNDRGVLFFLFMTLTNTMVHVNEREWRFDRIAQMKDRAVAAGIFPRLAAALAAHTTSDILCTALSTITATAGGGDYPETEARREAAASLLPAITNAMRLCPHRSAVQHFATQAVGAITARNTSGDISAAAARADNAISLGLHKTIIEAMYRHGHIAGENGLCEHEFEAAVAGQVPTKVRMKVPGSVLLSGCQVLQIMIHGGPRNDQRIKSLNDAHALKAVAASVRANPLFADFTDEKAQDLSSMDVVQPLIVKLFGDSKISDLVNGKDEATLIGFLAIEIWKWSAK
jgi:hypothetical protein